VLDAAQVGDLNNFGARANEGHVKISGGSPVRFSKSNAGPFGGDITVSLKTDRAHIQGWILILTNKGAHVKVWSLQKWNLVPKEQNVC
jgi:hypothetical protein